MALSESEELELLQLQKQKSMQSQPENGFGNVAGTILNAATAPFTGPVEAAGKVLGAVGSPSIPVPDAIKEPANAIASVTTRPARAAGVFGATSNALPFMSPTGATLAEGLKRGKAAYAQDYQPKTGRELLGASLGEGAATVVASLLNPMAGAALSAASNIDKTGKISPGDIAMAGAAGAEAMNPLKKPIAAKTLPPFLKSIKGIPTNVTREILADPSIMDLPGTSASIQGKVQPIINGIKEANLKTGSDLGKVYSDQAGLPNPVDALIGGDKAPALSPEQLRLQYHDAVSGDLFKVRDLGGGFREMSDAEKLAKLTELKRGLQAVPDYLPEGEQLGVSKGVSDASYKKMANHIDQLRSQIPGGDKMALVDDAWEEMQGIRNRLWKEFKDPYSGQDYLNRILKGNTDWLTSGRNAGKMGAIERVEQITGKQLLQPALKEMAASYVNNPDSFGLPSTSLKSMIGAVVPTKLMLRAATTPSSVPFLAGPVNSAANSINQAQSQPSPALMSAFSSWMDSLSHKGGK